VGPRLSNRERVILKLAAAGHTSAEIGCALKLSPKTVETYRSRVMRKLDLSSRRELVSYALVNRILSADNVDETNSFLFTATKLSSASIVFSD
jgi:DNA-binding CsgD family transcriptional regulator